jgi:hypothetical protein
MAPEDTLRQQERERKRRDWNTHITSWRTSRLSQTEYCRRHELKFHQFVYWRRKFVPAPAIPISLVQVPATAVAQAAGYGSRSSAMRVALAPDLSIEVCPGFDPLTLQQVVTALRGIRWFLSICRSSSQWVPPTCESPSTVFACWCRCTWRWIRLPGICLASATAAEIWSRSSTGTATGFASGKSAWSGTGLSGRRVLTRCLASRAERCTGFWRGSTSGSIVRTKRFIIL